MVLQARRKRDGTVIVTLDPGGARLLRELPERLREVLKRPDVSDRVLERLFPAAYGDPEKDAEYKKLLGGDLLRRKLENVDAFEKTLRDWKASRIQVDVTVKPEEFELWLGFVNDMRIVLGTELDVDDHWEQEGFDPSHPRGMDLALLHYLSWLEEELLQASGFA